MTNWESFICRMNGDIASVFADLALTQRAPIKGMDKLTWIWIRMNEPREDGLSSDAEFDALCGFEDHLERLVPRDTCVYAGRITRLGRREFYLYAHSGFDIHALAAQVLAECPDYVFQAGEQPDPEWGHYVNTLLPGEHGLAQIAARSRE